MGGGRHGGFGNTKGATAGDASFMGNSEAFLRNIRKRKDIDPGGKFDVIAHGRPNSMQIEHNGKKIDVNSRTAAQMISRLPGYRKGQPIRLLSCNTGVDEKGFAQNLANKLNVTVYAPSNYLWAWPDGSYRVAGIKPRRGSREGLVIDCGKPGKFIKYIPGGNRK